MDSSFSAVSTKDKRTIKGACTFTTSVINVTCILIDMKALMTALIFKLNIFRGMKVWLHF